MALKKAKEVKEPEVIEEEYCPTDVTEEPKQEDAPKVSFCMYLGPTILGVIQKASIYEGTFEDVIAKLEYAITKYPRIRLLLSTDINLPVDRVNVNTPGTRLYNEYRKLVAEVKR